MPQNFLQSTWKTEYAIKQYLSYIYWWYKSKYSSSPKEILKSAKNNLWKFVHQGDNFQSCNYWIS